MAVIRAGLICLCILGFFLLVGPLQRLSRGLGICVPGWPARLFCRLVLILLRVRVDVARGSPSRSARLLVANHVSWIDILVLGSLESPCFLAKQEVASWPLISAFAVLQGTVFVDRNRRRLLPQVNRTMADRMRQGRSVLLFPEGTTNDGHRRGPFRTSHLACLRDRFNQQPELRSGLVQAAALAYSDPAAAWIGDATLMPHLWAVLRRPPMTCRLVYGSERTIGRGYDRKALGRALAAEIEDHLERHAIAVTTTFDMRGHDSRRTNPYGPFEARGEAAHVDRTF